MNQEQFKNDLKKLCRNNFWSGFSSGVVTVLLCFVVAAVVLVAVIGG